jgi:hypothetical protein
MSHTAFSARQVYDTAPLGRSPETATSDDVRNFQRHLIDSGRSVHYRNRIMTGVKFLLKVTMRRQHLVAEIYHLGSPRRPSCSPPSRSCRCSRAHRA